MNRRDTVLALLGLCAAPLALRAQQAPKTYRIGVLSQHIPREKFIAFPAALREIGYVEGQNFVFEYRYAEGREDRLPALAADLVAKQVDLILALVNPEILAAKRATSTIPIVMIYGLTPVESGLVPSLARPGGNVTGTAVEDPEAAGKKLEILRDALPRLARVTVLLEPEYPGMLAYTRATERAAKAMGIRLTLLRVRSLEELEHAFTLITRDRPDALYVAAVGAVISHRARVIEFAALQRLPAIYTVNFVVKEGGLMAYAANQAALLRRTAAIFDRILKGARPADLPVEQPTQFELAINLKTAKTLGLTLPQSLLLRANEVIE